MLLVLFAGCGLTTGDDGDDVCNEAGGADQTGFRQPETGTCVFETTCTTGCPCPGTAGGPSDGTAVEEGGECSGPCTALGESACLASSQCHAAYLANESGSSMFWGCWDIAPQQPESSGSCDGLDAYSCIVDPSCTSTYTSGPDGTTFAACSANGSGSSCGGVTCSAGDHCEVECPPCNSAGCICGPTCVPDDQGPGDCYSPVTCNSAPPQCPSGTLPGVADGCWSGYCIPTAQCEAAPCAALATEAACTARADCEPVYAGMNCTCDANGCTCTSETFSSCESAATGL